MSDKIRVDYHEESQKFRIECPMWMNSYIKSMPSRRWSKTLRVWIAPAVRLNCHYLLDVDKRHLEFTDAALSKAISSIKNSEVKRLSMPPNFKYHTKPFDHQIKACDYIYSLPASALYMDMGLGKSKVAIDKFTCHIIERMIDGFVVLCPNSLKTNWVREINKHSGLMLDIVVHHSKTSVVKQIDNWLVNKSSKPSVLIMALETISSKERAGKAYEILVKYMDGEKGLIVDEAHFVKNHKSNRTINVKAISEMSPVKLIMTGTPISQGFMDLYSQFDILDSNILGVGDFWSFRNRYAEMGGYENREIIGYNKIDELMDIIKPYSFLMKKEQALDLPEKLYENRVVELLPEQKKVYKEMIKTKFLQLNKDVEIEADNVLVAQLHLQQIVGGFVSSKEVSWNEKIATKLHEIIKPEQNPKIKEIMSIIEVDTTAPIIIWAKYVEECRQIAQMIDEKYPGQSASYHSGIDEEQRQINFDDFINGKRRYFIATQQSGGTGLTMTNCNLVIYYSNSFKYVDRIQSEDRCHRIGQKRAVTYIDIMANNTVDGVIIQALKCKSDLANYVTDNLKVTDNILNLCGGF